jgi:transcriptional regulator with XRE-family HTH domain
MSEAHRPLRAVLGERVKALREAEGKRQDDLSLAARSLGLAWPRSKIGQLERGVKAISAEELMLLPAILGRALERHVTFAEIFGSGERVALSRATWVQSEEAADLLASQDPGGVLRRIYELTPAQEQRHFNAAVEGLLAKQRSQKLGLDARIADRRITELIAVEEASGDAEAAVARKLGEPTGVLVKLSLLLWGKSLSQERDERAGKDLPVNASPRTVQSKRGQVTRQLVNELREFIAEAEARTMEGAERPVK